MIIGKPISVNTIHRKLGINKLAMNKIGVNTMIIKKVKIAVDPNRGEWSDLLVKVGEEKDKQAFSRLYTHFSPLVKGFLMKGSSFGHEQAEELVQETMIKVWRKAASFNRQKSSASTWIYTIARNSRIDWYRREARRRVDLNADDFYESADENPAYLSVVQIENKKSIQKNIKLLPREQFDVITKIYYEGRSHGEVAEELNLPLGTVKSRIRLALRKMNLQLEPSEMEG